MFSLPGMASISSHEKYELSDIAAIFSQKDFKCTLFHMLQFTTIHLGTR